MTATAQRYCLGAPESSHRELNAEEREELLMAHRRQRRTTLVALSVVPACALVGYALAGAGGVVGGVMLPLIPALAVVILAQRDGAILKAAVHDRRVTRFEGDVDPTAWFQLRGKVQHARFELRPRNGGVPRALEVLEPSRLLWRIDGERPGGWRAVPVERIEGAALDPSTTDGATAGTRALTSVERAELVDHTRPMRVLRSAAPLLFNIALGAYLGIDAVLDMAKDAKASSVLFAAVWVLSAVMAIGALIRQLLRMRSLRRDLKDASVRWVLRDTDAGKGYRAPAPRPESLDESLPSGIPWTAAGVPAPWRRVRQPVT